MTQRDMAGYLGVTPMTLRNWRKEKPNLYKTIMLGLKFDELIEETKNISNKLQEFKSIVEQEVS
jgi:DNA-binding XRE family transcriptional regulator